MKPAAPPIPQAEPATGFTRRKALLAVAAISLAPDAAMAQTVPKVPVPKTPMPPEAAPVRVIRIRAEKIRQRLGTPEQAESGMFRLIETGAEGHNPAQAGVAPTFPVFRGREGEAFALEIENRLDQPTAFHLRGSRGPNAQDGMPGLTTAPLAPGSKLLLPVAVQQTGTFILSPVLAEHVAEQNARGLHAAVVVEEKAAQAASPQTPAQPASTQPAFDHDLVLAVGDWRLDDKGVLAEDFGARNDAARIGRLGNKLVANGVAAPGAMVVRPGARLRIRMVNVSNARMIPLKVSGFTAEVYSIDSTPCQPFDPLKRTVILAPASRIEMVLQAPAEAGKEGAIEAKIGNGLPIFAYRTEGEPLPGRGKLVALPDPGLPPAIRLQDAVRVEIAISGGIGPDPAEAGTAALEKRFADPKRVFSITSSPAGIGQNPGVQNPGGVAGFAGKPAASVKRGKVLVIALVNRTAWPQVIAVHGHAFRLLHPFDDGWEPYFLDTLYLAAKTTARIALIADNPGKWAIRSTIAEHFASGVATWFEVT